MGSAVRILVRGRTNGFGTGMQNSYGSPGVDLQVVEELVQRHAVFEPAEQLPDGQARAPEARSAAHARRIDPNRFFKRHVPGRRKPDKPGCSVTARFRSAHFIRPRRPNRPMAEIPRGPPNPSHTR